MWRIHPRVFGVIGGKMLPGRRQRTPDVDIGVLAGDFWIYLGSAVVAVACLWSHLRTIHQWAVLAWPAYFVAALSVAVALRLRLSARTVAALRWRLLAAVVLSAAVGPMVYEVVLRGRAGPMWAQSEVLIVEQATTAVLHGHSPYGRVYSADLLALRSHANSHFPYMPVMMTFGLPHAIFGSPLGDARVVFALAACAMAWYALAIADFDGPSRLRVVQVLFAIPPGSVAMATGGDDLPVLAGLLLTVVLMASNRPRAAGIAALTATLMKATAWPLLLAGITLRQPDQRACRRRRLALLGGPLLIAAAFALTSRRVWTDTILFPLGLGGTSSYADMTTLGRLTMALVSGGEQGTTLGKGVAAALLLLIVVGGWAVLILRRPPHGWPGVLAYATVLFLLLIAVDPIGRPGYFAYPLNMLCWRAAFLNSKRSAERATGGEA